MPDSFLTSFMGLIAFCAVLTVVAIGEIIRKINGE
jgi:hypothetical protein